MITHFLDHVYLMQVNLIGVTSINSFRGGVVVSTGSDIFQGPRFSNLKKSSYLQFLTTNLTLFLHHVTLVWWGAILFVGRTLAALWSQHWSASKANIHTWSNQSCNIPFVKFVICRKKKTAEDDDLNDMINDIIDDPEPEVSKQCVMRLIPHK